MSAQMVRVKTLRNVLPQWRGSQCGSRHGSRRPNISAMSAHRQGYSVPSCAMMCNDAR